MLKKLLVILAFASIAILCLGCQSQPGSSSPAQMTATADACSSSLDGEPSMASTDSVPGKSTLKAWESNLIDAGCTTLQEIKDAIKDEFGFKGKLLDTIADLVHDGIESIEHKE